MSVASATAWTAVLLGAGAAIVTVASGWQPAAAAVATWLIYVVVYTPMKKISPLNTAVGVVAGAMPVAIGWLAADGPQRLAGGDASGSLAAAALCTVLYLWQFPHFMAIAWIYRRQYAMAGLRMLSVDDPSGLRAAGQLRRLPTAWPQFDLPCVAMMRRPACCCSPRWECCWPCSLRQLSLAAQSP